METYDPSRAFSWNALARLKNFYRVSLPSLGVGVGPYSIRAPLMIGCRIALNPPQGFVPVVLRAFPTNAAALAVWEAVMRASTSSS